MGFFAHIFNGVVQTTIEFNSEFLRKTIANFSKTMLIMILASSVTALFVLIIPDILLIFLETDKLFLHQLVFYLFAFASFDFGLKN